MQFKDRREAGAALAGRLREWPGAGALRDPIVLALPRGGVPVAAEVARAIGAPLDVLVARKIGLPGHPETGIGAIAGEDPPVFDRQALAMLDLREEQLAPDVARERTELHRRELVYRDGLPAPEVAGRAVILVDDGLATGATAVAALRHLRRAGPDRLLLAVPVGSPHVGHALRDEADEIVCLHTPEDFRAVGQWYQDFGELTDTDVLDTLRDFRTRTG